MTQDKIVEMLKSPAKPDLAAATKAAKENPGLFGVTSQKDIKYWREAASISAAKGLASKLAAPPGIGSKQRQAFYRDYGNRGVVEKAMKEAGVKAWQKGLQPGDAAKRMKPEDFQFYVSIHLGSWRSSNWHILYSAWLRWDEQQKSPWPSIDDTGVSQDFLGKLENDSKSAIALAKLGYQNVAQYGNTVVFVKLPKQLHLDMVRTRYALSNPNGLALISASGAVKNYAFRGVYIGDKELTWKEESAKDLGDPVRVVDDKAVFDKLFADGKCKLTIKQALKLDNSELRRVFLETFEPEAILSDCDAVLLSKEQDKDGNTNELFSVDIGIPDQHRNGNLLWGDKITEWGKYPTRAKMLRYTCPSTGRVYAKFVPFEMQTANEAQAWGHHMTLTEYANELVSQS